MQSNEGSDQSERIEANYLAEAMARLRQAILAPTGGEVTLTKADAIALHAALPSPNHQQRERSDGCE